MHTLIDKVIFTALDTETTGLYPHLGDRICEIGAVKFNTSSSLAEFSTLVNPGIKIPRSISYLTGITNRMVKDAPSIEKIRDEFLSFIDGTVLVFHNAPFDLSFLNFELGGEIENLTIDTLVLARKYFDFPGNSLHKIADIYNIRYGRMHRAIDDAQVLSEIARKIFKGGNLRVETIGELLLKQKGNIKIRIV